MNVLKRIKDVLLFVFSSSSIAYRVIDIFRDSSPWLYKVRYQVIGKGGVAVEPIDKLVNDLVHVHGFSLRDSHLILKTCNDQKAFPSLTLLSISYKEESTFLFIKDEIEGQTFKVSLDYFLEDDEQIYKFSNSDRKHISLLVCDLIASIESKGIKSIQKKERHLKVLHF